MIHYIHVLQLQIWAALISFLYNRLLLDTLRHSYFFIRKRQKLRGMYQ